MRLVGGIFQNTQTIAAGECCSIGEMKQTIFITTFPPKSRLLPHQNHTSVTKQIIAVGQNKAQLSKAQKEFNRLTRKIPQLRDSIQQFEAGTLRLHQRKAGNLDPLFDTFAQHRASMVRLLDKAWDSGFFNAREKKKIQDLLLSMIGQLMVEFGHEELKPIYEKHTGEVYEEEAESDDLDMDEIKDMMENMFGVEIDKDADVDTPEKMEEYLHRLMKEAEETLAEKKRQAEERHAKRPKTAKQQAREAKKAQEAELKTKSVRTVYMDLIKAFHPDLEQDEAEKTRKTAIIQRVTEAYANNDLLTLLQLQLEFERIDQDHLETLADDRLKYYNKILLEQARELELMLYNTQMSLSMIFDLPPYMPCDLFSLERELEKNIKAMKKQIKLIEWDLQNLSDPKILKTFLKTHHF